MLPESKTFGEQPLIANYPELHSLLTSQLTPRSATAHSQYQEQLFTNGHAHLKSLSLHSGLSIPKSSKCINT